MATRMNGPLRSCLAGSALALVAFAYVPTARAQWMPPWGGAFPGQIERSLEAQGFVLTAPLMRRPGVYLADVSAGPAGYQRLVIDARSGQILERFVAPGRMWGPALAARNEEFGEPPLGAGPPPDPGFSRPPGAASPTKSVYGGAGYVHIPATIGPYGVGEQPTGTKSKSVSTERKARATKPVSTPPLPPPTAREAAKPDGSGSPPAEKHEPDQLRNDSRPTEVENVAPAVAPAAPSSSAEGSDKPKVSIVPPALFE
jgi:hypothetical protein